MKKIETTFRLKNARNIGCCFILRLQHVFFQTMFLVFFVLLICLFFPCDKADLEYDLFF